MRRTLSVIVTALLLAAPLVGCEEAGPLEKAGRKFDDAVDEITHPNEGALEKAGRKTDEALEDAREKLE